MKKNIIATIIGFTIHQGFSQEFKTETGTSFTKKNNQEITHITFPSAYGFMTYSHLDNVMTDNRKEIKLTKYDQSTNPIASSFFNLPKLGQRAADLLKVIELKDRLIFISKAMDKKSGKSEVYAQVYQEKENTINPYKTIASFPIESYSKSGFYKITVSPDQSKIAVYASMPYKKKTKEKIQTRVYDINLNLLWEQTETLTFDAKKVYHEKAFVANTGQVYLSKITDANKKARTTHLLEFNGNSVNTTTFSSDGFQPMNMKLITIDDTPMLIGFFWHGKKSIVSVGEGDENNGAFLYDLSEHTLLGKHLWKEKQTANNLKSLEVIDCKIIDNDIYMIGERKITKNEFRKNGNQSTMELDYYHTYGASILVNFDTKGTLKSFTPLLDTVEYKNEKKEKGSITTLYFEDGLRLFHNDSKNQISYNSYFSQREIGFKKPVIKLKATDLPRYWVIPCLLPNSLKKAEGYNLLYYISNYGDTYWLNKMSW